ncbi:MAG: 30S ribosomal protein S9 [Planctomycetaceae bacterium]|nr:30S ribosomal protein S9 [Planctomycetaceae bacterium]
MSATALGYTHGLGRRKSSVARVRLRPGNGAFQVNERGFDEYFVTPRDRQLAKSPLKLAGEEIAYDVVVQVHGGGPHSQAGAVELGIARALKQVNPALFEGLRQEGHLTRDSRVKERKHYGRRGARRGFQFSKR